MRFCLSSFAYFIFLMISPLLPAPNMKTMQGGWREKVLRHFGLVRLDSITEEDGTRWLLPDCLMLVLGPGCYLAIH
ncbi:hypothetical protein Anas_05512, partial [Armadillidium nasatum]